MSIEAMKQALDCLQTAYNLQQIDDLIPPHAPVKQAVAALRQAIEQADKQEPVAIVVAAEYEDGSHAGHRLEWRGRNEANDFPEGTAFYTTPQPQREWVGLTDDEIDKCCDFPLNALGMKNVRKIEAKLRSKNK